MDAEEIMIALMIIGLLVVTLVLPIVSVVFLVILHNRMRDLISRMLVMDQRTAELLHMVDAGRGSETEDKAVEKEPVAPAAQAAVTYPPPTPAVATPPERPASPVQDIPAASPAVPPPVSAVVEPPPLRQAGVHPPGTFERALSKLWNWFTVGSSYRRSGESREYAAATHWLMRIGIMIVLGGIAFFLKYSIEQGILGPLGRVVISIMVGTGLIIFGIRLIHNRYHLLAQGLSGAGFVTLYFAFFAASAMYALLPYGAAFVMMMVVTVAAGTLSIIYNTPGIALLGLVGGYATPLMVGHSSTNPLFFYVYVLLLGCGVLGVSLVRRWPYFNGIAMLAAYLLAFIYCHDHTTTTQLTHDLVFVSAIHLLFLLAMALFNLRAQRRTSQFEWVGLGLNALIYWLWAYFLFEPVFGRQGTGLIALVLAALYVGMVYLYLRRLPADHVAQAIFISLGAVFLTMAPVFILTAKWLTFAWSLQALAFVWIARRTGQHFMGRIALALFALAVLRGLLIDLDAFYVTDLPHKLTGWEFWRSAFSRWLLLGVLPTSLFTARNLVRRHRNAPQVLGLAIFLLWLLLTQEVQVLAKTLLPDFSDGLVTLTWTVFALSLLFSGIRNRGRYLRWSGLVLCGLAVIKLLLFDLSELETLYRIIAFILTGVLLVFGSFLYLSYRHLFQEDDGRQDTENSGE